MSFFAIVTGDVPETSGVSGLKFTPAIAAQSYIQRVANNLFPPEKVACTYLLDDGTGTSHDLIQRSTDEMLVQKIIFERTSLGKVLSFCLDRQCEIRVWWATNDPDSHLAPKTFRDRQAFERHLAENLLDEVRGDPVGHYQPNEL